MAMMEWKMKLVWGEGSAYISDMRSLGAGLEKR